MVKALIDPKKKAAVQDALKRGDFSGILGKKKSVEKKPEPAVEGPQERPTPVPPNPTSGLFGNPAAQEPWPTVMPPISRAEDLKKKSENPFAKYAPLIDEPQRPRVPKSKEELNRELLGVADGSALELKRLLGEGAEVDARNDDGWTALMRAASRGRAENCKVLIDAGADVNASDPNGYTALMGAASIGNTGIVLLLIESGANVNAKDISHGRSALDFATTWGRTDVIGILKNHGATEGDSDG